MSHYSTYTITMVERINSKALVSLLTCWLLCFTGVLAPVPEISRTHLYTATSDLAKLIHTEAKLIDLLNTHIEKEEESLERLKRFSSQAKQNQKLVVADDGGKLVNPIDIFATLKRFQDWGEEKKRLKNQSTATATLLEQLYLRPDTLVGSLLPSEEDLHGAADALFRLQDTYNLKASVMSDGQLLKRLYTETLTAAECLELGRIGWEHLSDKYHSLIWFQEALRKVQLEDTPTANQREILDYLIEALHAQGNPEHALLVARQIQTTEPDNIRIKDTIGMLESELKRQGKDPRSIKESEVPEIVNTRFNDGHLDNRDIYEALCRGEQQDESDAARLYCYYKKDTPYSKLAPFKIEVMRIKDPQVKILRGIVTDREVEMLQSLAEPKFFTTANFLKYRVSKSAWVGDEEDLLVQSMSRRIEQATGLSTESAEKLHLSCYGIGGHYEPHYDYFRPNEKDDNATFDFILRSGAGNRIATVLLYLSQPYLGGATVFTNLRLTLYPTKNDAAFWFNLHPDGTPNPMTRHAACPVLVGTKWIGNKWLHERGQEFRRLCPRENK